MMVWEYQEKEISSLMYKKMMLKTRWKSNTGFPKTPSISWVINETQTSEVCKNFCSSKEQSPKTNNKYLTYIKYTMYCKLRYIIELQTNEKNQDVNHFRKY